MAFGLGSLVFDLRFERLCTNTKDQKPKTEDQRKDYDFPNDRSNSLSSPGA
jgi:hypothetical protein